MSTQSQAESKSRKVKGKARTTGQVRDIVKSVGKIPEGVS